MLQLMLYFAFYLCEASILQYLSFNLYNKVLLQTKAHEKFVYEKCILFREHKMFHLEF